MLCQINYYHTIPYEQIIYLSVENMLSVHNAKQIVYSCTTITNTVVSCSQTSDLANFGNPSVAVLMYIHYMTPVYSGANYVQQCSRLLGLTHTDPECDMYHRDVDCVIQTSIPAHRRELL